MKKTRKQRTQKALQLHSASRLDEDRRVTAEQALEFLHQFSQFAAGDEGARKLISIRVPERLLELFRAKAQRNGRRYQSEIVRLMRESL